MLLLQTFIDFPYLRGWNSPHCEFQFTNIRTLAQGNNLIKNPAGVLMVSVQVIDTSVNAGAILDRVTPRKRGDAAEEN
jgi:hypothetical protein